MRRTQALTVLLALVRTDTGAGTLEMLQASGLLGSLLQELTGNARADLLQACNSPLQYGCTLPGLCCKQLE